MLIKSEKKFQLNSLNNLTDKNLEFLLSNENFIYDENKKNRTINYKNNSNRLSSKLIKLFNFKTNEILNSPEKTVQNFSKEKYQFRKDLINKYKKVQFNEIALKKLKQKYYEANDIIEKMNENKINKAKKLEKEFYKLKNEENYYKMKNKEILSLNNLRSLKKKRYLSISRIKIIPEFTKPLNTKRPSLKEKQIKNIIFNINKEDEKIQKAHISFNKYMSKKIKLNAKIFDDNINKLIFEKNQIKNSLCLDERTKKIKMIYKDILKSKEFNNMKNEHKEDGYKAQYNKLKKANNKCEDEYYRVCVFNNKNYQLSLLKPILKLKTIKKFLRIQDSNFGIPC